MENAPSIQQCPACSRIIHFTHRETTLLQCGCGSVIQRKEGVLVEKYFFLIPKPVAIIQPGTEGRWNGKAFKVSGRFRTWIKESVYNYWTIGFEDDTIGYLGEGYGLYAVYQKADVEGMLTSALPDRIKVGDQHKLYNGETFLLEHKDTCYKWELEGEVYLPECDVWFHIFEFTAQDGRHVEAIAFSKNHVETFNVTYVSFASLLLTNTRTWEPDEKELRCTSCSKQNTIKTFPYAQSYACIHCGARYALRENGDFELQKKHNSTDTGTGITLGASAMLRGIRYEVIGYALKEESNPEQSQWKEYTLFNPQEGFAFLSEYNGNWIYVREQVNTPVLEHQGATKFTYNSEPFQLFNQYGYETVNAAGEFPYNLFNDSDKNVREFISPPEMWIQEKSTGEGINWFLGEHIPRKELEAAFGEAIVMPYKSGVGAVEPKGFVSPVKIAAVAFIAVLVLVVAHIVSTVALQERIIFEQRISFNSLSTVSAVTSKFQLNKWRSNMQFDIEAPVDNNWFELNAMLVNADKGTEYSLEKGVEYYHGYTDSESWTEGGTRETAYISQIPAGTYYLQITGMREAGSTGYGAAVNGRPDGFYITVTYDTANNRNLVACLIALLVLPCIQFLIVQLNERSRWSNSPFSPYES